ncbi:hypothetical protein PR202_gb06432 [Eleusine coracana subsp. coracana]|uniref:UBP-type domain-containing protein n=1 Tax=Eleusine coracana subsp. coracana TaxID=191504 RepID=A0AAV5E8V3_ELECO|nr:hypothetical protein PR202_gb06432 [Eleusine coracana subsp. coracana]
MATAGKPAASRPLPAEHSSARSLDSVHFSSGNPRIEEARGVVLLHPDPPAASSSSDLPEGRKPQVCVLAVPNHMTYADFCRFCGSFIPHTLEMRIVRIDETEDQYSVLIKFDTQRSTDSFYKHFNGKQFSSLEVSGLYKGGHAIEHWKETQHCYSLELETQKVWDYAGDNYVHRLIQSKTDGKLVEYNCHGGHAADSTCSICSGDTGISEALLNSKVEAIVEEYNDLLTSQLEKQRNYYESLLLEVKEENEKEISIATEKALSAKIQKLQAKFHKCSEEKRFLDEINDNLVRDQETQKESIRKVLAREKAAIKLKDEKIQKLEEELRDLIAHVECRDAIAQAPESISSEIHGGTILPVVSASSSSSGGPVCGTRSERQ